MDFFFIGSFLISIIGNSGQCLGDPAYKWPVVTGEPAFLIRRALVPVSLPDYVKLATVVVVPEVRASL